jgi:hypothetical protein
MKLTKNSTSVLILCPYPTGSVPGQRFRYEQYLEILKNANINITIAPFLSTGSMNILYKPGHIFSKTKEVITGFWGRFLIMFHVFNYDYIFVHREASPFGPPIFELMLFLLKRKVIYDFDDAIFVRRLSRANPFLGLIKWTSKVKCICKHSYKVSVCNSYLVSWASQYNQDVVLIPTTIDPAYHRALEKNLNFPGKIPVIGWTGSQSNLSYLDIVRTALVDLQKKYEFEFRVICDIDPGFPELKNYHFVQWRYETEIADLGIFDIGLMPVPDGIWEKGKVGFKGIQYSALEITPIVSSVGSGFEVVEHEKTGFVVGNTKEEWYQALEKLLVNPDLIHKFGKAARARILEKYSVPSQANAYISLFQ